MSKVALVETGDGFASVTLHGNTQAAEKYRDDLILSFPEFKELNPTYMVADVEEPLSREELKIISGDGNKIEA